MNRNEEKARNNGQNGETAAQQRENDALKNYSPVRKDFDGTQPKIIPQRLATELTTASMDQLKQADAAAQGTTVEKLETAADLNDNATIDAPDVEEEAVNETEETEEVNMTVAELKAALDDAGVEYPSHALKADLQALYDEHVTE